MALGCGQPEADVGEFPEERSAVEATAVSAGPVVAEEVEVVPSETGPEGSGSAALDEALAAPQSPVLVEPVCDLNPTHTVLHKPCGSYEATCKNLATWGVYGDKFCADCKAISGAYRRTCVTKVDCPDWVLYNRDGQLACSSKKKKAVSSAAGLRDALRSGEECVTIEITADLDLTHIHEDDAGLPIPRGVTLAGVAASGAPKPRLWVTEEREFPMFQVAAPDVRITGLRIQGPSTAIPGPSSNSDGIRATGALGLQVDNSELWGWPHASIYLVRSKYAFIHHNKIHDNRRNGIGYGVCLGQGSSAAIESNCFDANRHAITGTGDKDVSYLARKNWVGKVQQADGQSFDMHGVYERFDHAPENTRPWAGCTIDISGNTFLGTSQPAVMIRGISAASAGTRIHDNFVAGQITSRTFHQWLRTDKGDVDWASWTRLFPDRHWHVYGNRVGNANAACPL